MFAAKKLAAATAAAVEKLYVEDVFSTYLYTGNGSTQTITNGIDLSGEGGLVWIKDRSVARQNELFDTARGTLKTLRTNSTAAQVTSADSLTAFNSNGFSIGLDGSTNANTETYASWTFRKAEKFFDVVTWTGTGTAQNISHNLGSTPGCIMIKSTSITGNWWVWHRTLPDARYGLYLNGTGAQTTSDTTLDWTDPTSTQFRVGTSALTNSNGATYVAYLFAHDAGGFGDAGDQSVVKCGSYTGNGSSTGPEINLGWEPQWILIKQSSSSGNDWQLYDNMRGMAVGSGGDYGLFPNLTAVEDTNATIIKPLATGFQLETTAGALNANGSTYIYIAIRRGPMKTPEAGTEVFSAFAASSTGTPRTVTTGFPVDLSLNTTRTSARINNAMDRLRGGSTTSYVRLQTESTAAESSGGSQGIGFDNNTALIDNDWWSSYSDAIYWSFRRAPGFFDVVCYTGTGSATTVSHNLGVAPELMIVKSRTNSSANWAVYNSTIGNTKYLLLNTSSGALTASTLWNNTSPTSSVFTVGTGTSSNENGATFVAYLFASVAGVSKVGSFTGNGTNQTINCGFTAGARFVLIKKTSGSGNWYVWDSARGIVSGNDPYLLLNSTAAEVTTDDSIDTDSTGFVVNQTGTTDVNANGDTYIYLAIA